MGKYMHNNFYSTVWNSVIKHNLELGNRATQNTIAVWHTALQHSLQGKARLVQAQITEGSWGVVSLNEPRRINRDT